MPRLVSAFTPPPWRDPAAMTATDHRRRWRKRSLRPAKIPAYSSPRWTALIAGFIHVRSLEDYYRRRKHGHVADLVVAEGQEGQGIATALLAKAEEWSRAQGYDWMTLGRLRAECSARNGFIRSWATAAT